MRRVCSGLILALAAGLSALFAHGEEPTAGEAVVTDVDGKEHKISSVKFTTGTRRLARQADPKGSTEDSKKGPLALEVRESTSAMPLRRNRHTRPCRQPRIRQIRLREERVALGVKGLSHPLTGALFYPGVNVLGLSGSGDGMTVGFVGGVRGKTGVKSAVFGDAQPVAKSKGGTAWKIQIVKTKKDEPVVDDPTLIARNLKVLVSFPGGIEQLFDGIPVRKGAPIPFDASLKCFELLANDFNTNFAAAEVEAGGTPERVIAIPLTIEQDKKTGSFVGILGEVDAGWKLFPLHTIKTIKPSMRKIE